MSEYVDRVTLPQRLGAGAAIATGVLELTLAVMALYGVIAFAASQRRREVGLRMALGASRRSVIALIMREGLVLTGVGVVLGAGVALVGGAALGSLLIGIGPADPLSFGGAALVLLLSAPQRATSPPGARRASTQAPRLEASDSINLVHSHRNVCHGAAAPSRRRDAKTRSLRVYFATSCLVPS